MKASTALLKQLFWGFFVSALGAIPLGVLNITSMQLAIYQGFMVAWSFALGAALVEVAYARLLLAGLQQIMHYKKLLAIMDWVAFGIVAVLAIAATYAALHPAEANEVLLRPLSIYAALVLGISLSATNPMQFPYWLGWSTILVSSNRIGTGNRNFNIYTLGIGLGTLAGLAIFIYGGPLLINHLDNAQAIIQWAVAVVLAATAIVFLLKILRGKGSAASLQQAANKSQ